MPRIIALILNFLLISSIAAQKLPAEYYRAQAAVINSDYKLASQWIDSAIASTPRSHYVWLIKGEIEFRLSNFEQAKNSFTRAEDYRKNIASYWLAKTYAMQHDTTNALVELERHLSALPKETEATILLDTAFNPIKSTQQWRFFWLNSWYTPNERFLADIYYHFGRNEWEYALDLLNERLDGKRGRHQLYALRGEAFFSIGSYTAAEKDFKKALKINSRNHSYLALQAKSLVELKKHKKAIRLLNKAIENSGGDPQYYKIRSTALGESHDYDNAIEDIKYYLTFYPNDIEAISLFAEYSIHGGKFINALLQLGRLIKEMPNEPKYYILRANVYMHSNNWTFAEMDFDKALELDPNNAEVYFNRGICNHKLGKNAEACISWKQAIKLGSFNAQEYEYKYCK